MVLVVTEPAAIQYREPSHAVVNGRVWISVFLRPRRDVGGLAERPA